MSILALPPTARASWSAAVLRVFILATLVEACGDSTGPRGCTAGRVGPITVGSGVIPSISWAAPCPAVTLGVYFPNSGLPTWELEAGARPIPNPTTYGVVPTGVTELHAAEALQTGTQYGVLIQILTTHGDTLGEIATFTP